VLRERGAVLPSPPPDLRFLERISAGPRERRRRWR
jgi:hypothetical protein